MKADPNITARIIADSINPYGNRLTTFVITIPRIILAEFNTHRTFSRNSASSRAIPIEKQLSKVTENPFVPVQFGRNQKGMQASKEIDDIKAANAEWLEAKIRALVHADKMKELGVHKQIANRLIEPWLYTTIIVSMTSGLYNFFALRAHKDAQPEMQVSAYRMLEAYLASTPQELEAGDWHLPFGDRIPDAVDLETRKKICTARCARVSYETFDGEININSDIELHDRLASSGHWSPFEHVAMSSAEKGLRSGNFIGFMQYRSTFNHECRSKFDTNLELILENKPEWI